MLANNSFRVDTNVELNNSALKMLVYFYAPLIGNDALMIYEFLALKGNSGFDFLSKLLNSLNINVNSFEENIEKLNEFKLLKTLKNEEDKYIFVLNSPLSLKEFINDDILVRNFILKTSGEYYKSLISNNNFTNENYSGYDDISKKITIESLKNWNIEDETYLKKEKEEFKFDSIFDIEHFLKGISSNLFPLRLRTRDNLKEIVKLADLYNISYEKMKRFLPQIIKADSNEMDVIKLKSLCISNVGEIKEATIGDYNVPCLVYLQALLNGKELTPYDKKVIYTLSHDYDLTYSVINVLLEHTLKNCEGRMIEKFYLPIASDFYRNSIKTAEDALNRLKKYNNKVELPKYDSSNNVSYDPEKLQEILNRRGSNE